MWNGNDASFQSKLNVFKLYRNTPGLQVYNCKHCHGNVHGYDGKDQDLTCVTSFYYTQAILPFPDAQLLSNARIQ